MHRNRAILLLAAGLLSAGGCATVKSHWPFGKAKVSAPEPVQELQIEAPAGEAVPAVLQFWERNTLVVDLTNASATGRLQLVRDQARAWPVRVAFRMAPGRFEALEVQGAQRMVLPVATGDGVVDGGAAARRLRERDHPARPAMGRQGRFLIPDDPQ